MNNARRIIAITGATRGLGRALVSAFTSAGHIVVGCGRSTAIVDELSHSFPSPHGFRVLDVTDSSGLDSWAREVVALHGPPDLLINNAAVMNPLAPLWKISEADFNRVIDVNVKGVANAIRAFVPAMVKAKSGVIVNISSGWGRSTSPEVAPYCASKYAIEGLTLALSQELPDGMAAVPLNPGIINTEMLREAWGEGANRYPTAGEWVKRAAPFLLGLDAKVNGKSLSV